MKHLLISFAVAGVISLAWVSSPGAADVQVGVWRQGKNKKICASYAVTLAPAGATVTVTNADRTSLSFVVAAGDVSGAFAEGLRLACELAADKSRQSPVKKSYILTLGATGVAVNLGGFVGNI